MKADEQILIGIRQIQQVLGGASENTVLKWIKEYPSIPIKKIGGQWTSMRDELRRWWQHLVTDTLSAYRPVIPSDIENKTLKGAKSYERKKNASNAGHEAHHAGR